MCRNMSTNTECSRKHSKHTICKILFVFILIILAASSAFAFGHGGKSRKRSVYHGTGVDSIGVYPGDSRSVPCPDHSKRVKGLCKCDEGYTPNLEGLCVEDQCLDFEETACKLECNPLTGNIKTANEGTPCGIGQICDGQGNCLCDNNNHYYGEPGSCQLCQGEGKIFKNNTCICDDAYDAIENSCYLKCDDHKIRNTDHTCVCETGWTSYNNTCMPATRALCKKEGFYWCHTVEACVTDEAACLALCPEEKLCGSEGSQVCCGLGNTCVNGQCCNDEGHCCSAGSPGYNSTKNTCCDTNSWLSSVESYSVTGSGYNNTMCCPIDSDGFAVAEDRCCNPDEVLMGFWCCPSGTTEYSLATGCCTPDKNKRYYDDMPICCDEGQTPYCAQRDLDGLCISGGCCKGDVSENAAINGADVCCPTGQVAQCYKRDNDGNCWSMFCCPAGQKTYVSTKYGYGPEYSCCSGTVYEGIGYDGKDLCCSPEAEVVLTNEGYHGCCTGTVHRGIGTNNTDLCCPSNTPLSCADTDNNGNCKLGFCCRSGYTAYCSKRDEQGECLDGGCCAPGDLRAYDNVLACTNSNQVTTYCAKTNSQGRCIEARSCGAYNLTDLGNGIIECPGSWYKAYCRIRDRSGACIEGNSWCSYNYDIRCAEEYDNGVCRMSICCPSNQQPYCWKFDENGTCLNASCVSDGYTVSCVDEDENGICRLKRSCQPNQQSYCARRKDGRCTQDACCPADYVIACVDFDENGTCIQNSCCAPENTPYMGSDQGYYCCSGTIQKGVSDYGSDLCCSDIQTMYCAQKDSQGNCTKYSCCSGSITEHIGWNGADLCCAENQTGYCLYRDNNHQCKATSCCSQTIRYGVGWNGADVCISN